MARQEGSDTSAAMTIPAEGRSLVYDSAKGVLVCTALAAAVSWMGPYYLISCEKTADGVNCRLRQMLIGFIPWTVHDVSGVKSINSEKHGTGRGATTHLQLQGSDLFDFRADRAPIALKRLEELLEAPAGERLLFSDGIVLWGLYVPVMVFLFGFFAVAIALDHHPAGPLVKLPDVTEFCIGLYLGIGAAGFPFVFLTDVFRTPLWGWSLLGLIAMTAGTINVVRVRLKGNRAKPSVETLHSEDE